MGPGQRGTLAAPNPTLLALLRVDCLEGNTYLTALCGPEARSLLGLVANQTYYNALTRIYFETLALTLTAAGRLT